MNDCNKEELINQAKKGERDGFGGLVLIYYDMIYRLCIKLTGNISEAEDLAQDTFYKALENISKLKKRSSFSIWLFKITRNLWFNSDKIINYGNILPYRW